MTRKKVRALEYGAGWLAFAMLVSAILIWTWIALAQALGFIGLWEEQRPHPAIVLVAMFLALGCLLSALFAVMRELQGHRVTRHEGKMRMIP